MQLIHRFLLMNCILMGILYHHGIRVVLDLLRFLFGIIIRLLRLIVSLRHYKLITY